RPHDRGPHRLRRDRRTACPVMGIGVFHTPYEIRVRSSSRISAVLLAPIRSQPSRTQAITPSRVRTPPAALSLTWGGDSRRIRIRSASVDPPLPYPVDVLT